MVPRATVVTVGERLRGHVCSSCTRARPLTFIGRPGNDFASGNFSLFQVGWWGAGVEWAFAPNWSAKVPFATPVNGKSSPAAAQAWRPRPVGSLMRYTRGVLCRPSMMVLGQGQGAQNLFGTVE